MNAEYIESNLLNQLRLITVGHLFPVWVQKTCIFVKAGKYISRHFQCSVIFLQEDM